MKYVLLKILSEGIYIEHFSDKFWCNIVQPFFFGKSLSFGENFRHYTNAFFSMQYEQKKVSI